MTLKIKEKPYPVIVVKEVDCGFHVILIESHINMSNARALKTRLESIIEKSPEKIILDFKDIKQVDSSGLGSLVAAYKELKVFGGKLLLINTSDSIKAIIELSKLSKMLPSYDSLDEALDL